MFEVARCRNLFLGEATNTLGFLEESVIIIIWFLFRLLIERNCLGFLLLEEEVLEALQHTPSLTLTRQ